MVELQTTSGVLATLVAYWNAGATVTESGGTWTVSHASKLIISADVAHQAGFSICSLHPTAWWASDARDLVTAGVIVCHTFREMIIEASGTEQPYRVSTGPTRAESQEKPPLTWRRRLQGYGVV